MDAMQLPEFAGEVELDGKVYPVPPPTEDNYRELSEWLQDRALSRIERQRGAVSEQVYQDRYDATLRLICAGVLNPGQPEFDRAMMALEAREQLLWIVLRGKYKDAVTRDQVRTLFGDIVKQIVAANIRRHETPPEPTAAPQPEPSLPSTP